MTEEMEKKVQEMYKELKKEQETKKEVQELWQKLWKKITDMEKNPTIIDYLQLKEKIKDVEEITDQQIETDEDFFDTIANQFHGEETNHIYVYMWRFWIWREYKDIERHDAEATIQVPVEERMKFEEENIVLFAPEGLDSQKFYELVRRTFFKYAIEFGQEEAVQKIVEEFGNAEQIVKRKRSKKQTESITKLV